MKGFVLILLWLALAFGAAWLFGSVARFGQGDDE